MTKDKSKSQDTKTRLFPIILVIIAVVFLNILAYYRNKCLIIGSLGSLTLTMSIFLFMITFFYEINKFVDFDIKKISVFVKENFINKIVGLFKKYFGKQEIIIYEEEKENPQETEETSVQQNGLFEIKKENVSQQRQEDISLEKRIFSYFYIISFLIIAFWRIIRILKVLPLSYSDNYHSNIVDAILLLVLPCVAVLYLKMRKDSDSCPTDKVSRDILTFFSYISFFYAAVIAAASVLKINILIILQWFYYAASVYLVLSLVINILLAMLKGNVLSFDYSLFPKYLLSKEQFAETMAKWKISIKSLYTIRYTLKILPALALALIFVLFLSTGVFVVQPHQQAAVYHFGKLDRSSIKDSGLHFKFPYPIDKMEIYDVHRVASMQIGYESSGTADFLWTQKHDIGEYMLLLGNGNEMAAVNLKILYVISDLYSYIKTCANAEAVLSAAVYNALMTRTINTTLDSFLNVDRNSLSASVMDELSAFCESENLGFTVVQVIIENIHPPVDIADVYQKVVSASVDKTTMITRAQTYAETRVIEAAKQSKFAIDGARAMQYDRTSDAQKESAVFYAATEAYRISPVSYELTKNLDVYQKIIKSNKVYAFSRGTENTISKFIIGKINTVNLLDVNKGVGNE
jgi:regulator of protease activity HflC (stomatin/prohibitin superfamily)